MDVQTPLMNGAQPVKSELSVNQDNDNLVTLVHTVSFYRRQQTANVSKLKSVTIWYWELIVILILIELQLYTNA